MALKRNETYPGRFENPTTAHPQGAFKNRTAPAAQDGSYLEQQWANDWDGFFGRLLTVGNVTADGSADTALVSQYFTALSNVIRSYSSGVIGTTRGLLCNIPSVSSSATFIADEVILGASLGGQQFRLANLNKVLNISTTGAGGMDTGTPPTTGFMGVYAIYNPTTQVSALLGVNATGVNLPSVYGGSFMPSGYTFSALIGVIPIASSQFVVSYQIDRTIYLIRNSVFTTTTQQTSWTSLSVSNSIPMNAKTFIGDAAGSTNTGNITIGAASDAAQLAAVWPTFVALGQIPFTIPIKTPQTIYYIDNISSGSGINFQIFLKGYSI